ncbi:MAG: hypothetical protein R3C18_02530 [Planctomycetaceae bacterium]
MKTFSSLIMLSLLVAAASAASADDLSPEEQAKKDQLHIAVQRICPVSGQSLGDHGAPIRVTVGEKKEEIFLCCEGCLKQKIDPKYWATMHANIAEAQRICPIMKKPLPKSAKWTIVGGRVVYVCCPPCTDKIAADPATYLTAVDNLYAESVAQREGTK